MTPEERFEHIEEALVRIVDIQREQAEVQRRQAAVLLELSQRHAELAERVDAVILMLERFLSRGQQ